MPADPADLTAWKLRRLQELTAETGWLNLTDRVPLRLGSQSVGRAAGNDVVLSVGPDHLGELVLTADGGTFQMSGGPVLPFQPGEGFPQLRLPALLLELHSADGETALRLRDLTLPRDIKLTYYPFDPEWIIDAEWHKLEEPEAKEIGQKGGGATTVRLTHVARFSHAGQSYALSPTHWKSGKPMFVIRDRTSGPETYAASRFLIGEDLGQGRIRLDFNRAHNPPCAFTEFAICPLPPRENILPVAIRAGELKP